MSLSPTHQAIINEIDQLMIQFPHTKKDLGYGYRRTFDNKMRFDIIDYKCKGIQILRVWRGARLIRQYPQLAGLFDEIAIVIAKMQLPSIKMIHDKHLIGLFQILHEAPAKIGAFD